MITNYLFERAGDLIKQYPEVRDEGKGYKMADDGGVELEVGEFLYGMVKILKPGYVLETGTYTGISAMYMGQALKENDRGHLVTIEIDEYHKNRAEKLWQQVGINGEITCRHMKSYDYTPSGKAELMFLDSEPNLRFHELVKFYPYLAEGGYVFIHDTPRSLCQGNINPDHPEIESWPFTNLPEEIKQWIRNGELRMMHFPNPRGMCGFYKVHKDDYKC